MKELIRQAVHYGCTIETLAALEDIAGFKSSTQISEKFTRYDKPRRTPVDQGERNERFLSEGF